MNNLYASLVALFFSVAFYLTSKSERCWYRREIMPVMLVILSVLTFDQSDLFPAVIFVSSALLVYYGYKGYGIEIKKKKK